MQLILYYAPNACSLVPLGPRASTRTSSGESWRLGRLDQHRDDANPAEPLLGRSQSLHQLERCRTTSGLSSRASAWVSLTLG